MIILHPEAQSKEKKRNCVARGRRKTFGRKISLYDAGTQKAKWEAPLSKEFKTKGGKKRLKEYYS